MLHAFGATARTISKASPLPSAPTPTNTRAHSLSKGPRVNAVVIHLSHIDIPRIDEQPTLSDFISTPIRSLPEKQMVRITNFIQRYPDDGTPVSEPTTAYLGYTREYLYAAFVCKDKNPKSVRAHMLARDSLGDDDDVELTLDTFDDQRRAFVFDSNALGIQADALYSEQNGSDYSFDTVWDTWGKRTAFGYVVLMRIPFSSLYFAKAAPGQKRTWGIILKRTISQTNESAYWPQNRHDVAGHLTQDIPAVGFSDIQHGQNLQMEPYVLGRNLRQLNTVNPIDPYFQDKKLQGFTGLDAKFILHNSLVLDTTINPDFSQVGIDNPAAPNQRFPPFFAEVRPFFIENSSYFMSPVNLYYTNTIVTPQFGARLTGKLGPWALGLLGVDDRSPGQNVLPQNPEANTRAHFYIGRVNRDVGSLYNVGIIYADREYLNSFNRAGGFDYRARIKSNWTLEGQAVTSATRNFRNYAPGEQPCEASTSVCSGQALSQQLDYSSLHRNWWVNYDDTSAGFITDTGFFRRPDVRDPSGRYSYTFRPEHGPILSHGPNLYSERIWDHNGVPLGFYLSPNYNVTFKYLTSVSAYVHLKQDRLRPIDYSALHTDVEYHTRTGGLNFYSSPLPYLAIGGGLYTGTTINYAPPNGLGPSPVNVTSPGLNLELKPFSSVDLQNSYKYTHFTNPTNGDLVYDNQELISRWNYQMTKAFSLNLIGQYISTSPNAQYSSLPNTQTVFADALFTYLPHPGTAIYVGYIGNFANLNPDLCTREANGTCNTSDPILPATESSLLNDGRTIYVKISYLLRF